MLHFNDLLTAGYSLQSHRESTTERRPILPSEPIYAKLLQLAKDTNAACDKEAWQKIDEAITQKYGRAYHLFTYSQHGTEDQKDCEKEITGIAVYYDDPKASGAFITKGQNRLYVVYANDSGFIYRIKDYSPGFDHSFPPEYEGEKWDIASLFEAMRKERQKRHKEIMAHYNQLLKQTKKDYKEDLDVIHDMLHNI